MPHTILILEDEPLILMDLEFAAQDRGCEALTALCKEDALAFVAERRGDLSVAVLDVSLGAGNTCLPVARELDRLAIPYLLHSGDLDRHDETIRDLDAALIAKPACADTVVETALSLAPDKGDGAEKHTVE
ncbi:MAG: response regulator [Pseudomonadota bacterium]